MKWFLLAGWLFCEVLAYKTEGLDGAIFSISSAIYLCTAIVIIKLERLMINLIIIPKENKEVVK